MNQTILIADDDLGLAEVLAARCEAMGLNTIVVDNAQCALLAIVCEQPDLAVFDLNMPQADAGDVFDLLATDPELTDLPVIVLTGQTGKSVIERCEILNAYYVAKKGDVWRRLRSQITEILGVPQFRPAARTRTPVLM